MLSEQHKLFKLIWQNT